VAVAAAAEVGSAAAAAAAAAAAGVLVASRSAARYGGIGIDLSLLGWRGTGEAWGGSEPRLDIGLTKGKGGWSSGPGTKPWSRVGDGDDNGVVFGERRNRRPGFGDFVD